MVTVILFWLAAAVALIVAGVKLKDGVNPVIFVKSFHTTAAL